MGYHPPPPSVKPETPTVGMRPPTMLIPVESRAAYAWSQVMPDPTSTVPVALLSSTLLKRVMEIWTPLVEENPGLNAWPPPFTAKGVRVDPKMRNYHNTL